MKLELKRKWFSDHTTIGELYLDGQFECFTLEDVMRPPGVKIPCKTAIPAGTYRVAVTMSARFGRPLPLLIGVPNFEGVRIHPGNSEYDTEGCILVGCQRFKDRIGLSRPAFAQLFDKLEPEAKKLDPDIWITITNEPVDGGPHATHS